MAALHLKSGLYPKVGVARTCSVGPRRVPHGQDVCTTSFTSMPHTGRGHRLRPSRFAFRGGGLSPPPPAFPVVTYVRLLLNQVDGGLHHVVGRGDRLGIGLVSAFGLDEHGECRSDVHVGCLQRAPVQCSPATASQVSPHWRPRKPNSLGSRLIRGLSGRRNWGKVASAIWPKETVWPFERTPLMIPEESME